VLKKIDSAILAGCTRFSHWLQRMTGLTNYFVANVGTGCAAIGMMLRIANYFHRMFDEPTTLFDTVIYGAMMFVAISTSLNCTRAQDDFLSGKITKPAELQMYYSLGNFVRLPFAALFLLQSFTLCLRLPQNPYWLLNIAGRTFPTLGFTTFFYFIVVDPLPPGRSKVRQLLERLLGVREAVSTI
jgi:hypothetical protein